MRKKLYIAGAVVCGLLILAAAGLVLMYKGAQQVPEEYRHAVQIEQDVLREANDEMLQQATALASDVAKEGSWQALFTDRQINGWLAVDLPENHSLILPESMSDPRVAISPEGVKLYCRFHHKSIDSVVTLTVEPYMAEPNVLAFRIHRIRAGIIPVPLDKVLSAISKAALKAEMPLRWRQAEGDPVALLTIPQPRDENDKIVEIESLRLGEGEIYLSGKTQRRE